MKNKRINIAMACFAIWSVTYTQDSGCEAAKTSFLQFDGKCISKIASNNCVNLDITDSYDFEGKEFVFVWDMGDGTTLEGLNIDHCYENPGPYIATLSLEDPITKATIQEEASIDIIIKGSFELIMNPLEDVRTNIAENASFVLDYPDSAYQLKYTYWDFGDGNFSCEESPDHTYERTGVYYRSLLIGLESEIDDVTLCASDSVSVKLADPTAGMLTKALDQLSIDSRFLEDKSSYFLLKQNNDGYEEVERMEDLVGGGSYRIIAFRGNRIYDSGDITMPAESDQKSIQQTISDKTKQLAEQEPLILDPLFFELDQNELSRKMKKSLNDHIELLEELPMMKVELGVYTTSGGSFNRGVALAVKRAEIIKQYMVDEGVDRERVSVSNPNTSRSLINTCLTGSDCDYVDQSLDRRADFKLKIRR